MGIVVVWISLDERTYHVISFWESTSVAPAAASILRL